MNSDEWTTRDWIIRGLVASCISEHALYSWYRKNVPLNRIVSDVEFGIELRLAIAHDLVYPQRQVPCYEHRSYMMTAPMEAGWALTDEGGRLDLAMRRT